VSPENPAFDRVRTYAIKLRSAELNFNSEHIEAAPNVYVGWLDLMGAGHVMSISVQKTANFLARLHIAVERARSAINFSGRLLPINDGIFIVSNSKKEIISLLGRAMIMLAANFVAVPRRHDRFLLRGGVAYGPVYFGDTVAEIRRRDGAVDIQRAVHDLREPRGSIRGRRKGRLNQVRRQALPLRNLRRRSACARVRGRAGKGGESNGRFCRRVWRDSSLHPEKVDAWLMNVVGGWNVASTAAAVNDIRAGRREEGFDMGDALHGVLNLY
jgi:hypothetical protein